MQKCTLSLIKYICSNYVTPLFLVTGLSPINPSPPSWTYPSHCIIQMRSHRRYLGIWYRAGIQPANDGGWWGSFESSMDMMR
jgi:hypothetical protein